MVDSMLFNLLLNIGLLVLIATMLTNLPPVRALLLEEKQTFRSRLWLSLIFGMVSICSTYIGVPIQGAIVNTRVIGVMAAGLLGGPYVGVGAALIVNVVAHFPIYIQPWSVMLSFAVCTVTGVFFGWYPAKKAAQLDPIEAIRYE